MEGEAGNYKDFFGNTSTPTNYLTVVSSIKTFIDCNMRRSRRIVLVTVSYSCFLLSVNGSSLLVQPVCKQLFLGLK